MDYVIARHVVEHVPNFIGCLLDLSGALVERGLICLAVPDRRFTFDIRRPESTAGEMVESYLTGVKRPAARQLFDQMATGISFPKDDAWHRDVLQDRPVEPASCNWAYSHAVRVTTTSDYVDAHCWVFTPASFLDVAEVLTHVGLFPFTVEYFHPTETGDYEFYTRLRKAAVDERSDTLASIASARRKLDGWGPEVAYRQMKARDALAKAEYESRIDELQSLIFAYQTSHSWRATQPLRWLGTRLRSAKTAIKRFRARAA